MNTATEINSWAVPVQERKSTARSDTPRAQEKTDEQSLWKICQAESKAKGRESSFYAFFFVLAAIGTASAFAVLHEMTSTGSLTYFVQHALR
jgi:hypothetical protein